MQVTSPPLDDGLILPQPLRGIYSTKLFLLKRLLPSRSVVHCDKFIAIRFITERQLSLGWRHKNITGDDAETIFRQSFLILLLIYKILCIN